MTRAAETVRRWRWTTGYCIAWGAALAVYALVVR